MEVRSALATGLRDSVRERAKLVAAGGRLESIRLRGGAQRQRVVRDGVQEFRKRERKRVVFFVRHERDAVAAHLQPSAAVAQAVEMNDVQ